MGRVASFGSINVDRMAPVDAGTLAELRSRYDWFPAPGETRDVDSLPGGIDEHVAGTLLGGKGANQAVAAASAGAESHLYGKVGEDAGEVDARASLEARGVDVSAVGTAPGPTGTAYVFVGPDGESFIPILGGANDAVDAAYARSKGESVGSADVLLIQNEVPHDGTLTLLNALAAAEDRPTVILDPAPADTSAPLVEHPAVDVVKPNETEAAELAGVLQSFEGVVVRTRGPEPVVVETPTDRFEVAPPAVPVVDTTGAGDVFAGYLAAELADGGDLRDAVELACAAAALSVGEEGVQQATPDGEAVQHGVRR